MRVKAVSLIRNMVLGDYYRLELLENALRYAPKISRIRCWSTGGSAFARYRVCITCVPPHATSASLRRSAIKDESKIVRTGSVS